MATSGPGIDMPGTLFIGDINAQKVVIGKLLALVIDNTTNPPTVSLAGSPIATQAYVDSHAVELYGTGVDGNATIAVNSALTRDTYYNNLTINTGIILDTAGFRLFVKGTLTLVGTGSIAGDGLAGGSGAAGAGTAGAALAVGTLGASGAGGAGGAATAAGVAGGSTTVSEGSTAGIGGTGNNAGTAAGAAGTATPPTAPGGGLQIWNDILQAQRGRDLVGNLVAGGAGGGGGGGSSATSGGGGGGSGGRTVVVSANTISGSVGTISARGGAGGAGGATGTGGGGGGGGGGGSVVFIYNTAAGGFLPAQVVAPGGLGGAGGAAGGAVGAPGLAGTVYVFKI